MRLSFAGLAAGRVAAAALLSLAHLLAGCLLAGCSGKPAAQPANVLLYVVDTLRADAVGALGNPDASTPGFDRFAAEGTLFERAYANSSWTRASVASILTGLYPPRHGAESRADALPADVVTLADLLTAQGYSAGFITTNPNVGSFFGFDRAGDTIELYRRRETGRVDSHELTTPSSDVTRRALAWIDEARRPFLLTLLTIDPHAPYTPPARFDAGAEDYRGPLDGSLESLSRRHLSSADKRRARALYDAEVSFNDESFGALLEGLRARGLLDATLLVLTADHGEEFWEQGRRGHGRSLAETTLRVPLVIRHPGSPRVGRGVRDPRVVELVDLVPSILDLLGLPLPEGLDGRSLFAAAGDASAGTTFASLRLDGRQLWSLQRPPWKLVRDLDAGADALYDVGRQLRVGGRPSDAAAGEARRARRDLEAELDRIAGEFLDTHGGRSRAAGAMPGEVEEAMRALGYVD